MNGMQTIAAIDVGSNAIRLLIAKVDEKGQPLAMESRRAAVRLGKDAFLNGVISEASMQATVDAFTEFQKEIHERGVCQFRAVSTSATREASNQKVLAERIRQATGIRVEVISGKEEARLIHLAVSKVVDLQRTTALLIDIGAGSVEATLSVNGNIISTESYKIGALRLLSLLGQPGNHGLSDEERVLDLIQIPLRRIREILHNQPTTLLVGTGGNMEALGEMAYKFLHCRNNRMISRKDLGILIKRMGSLSYEERIHQFDLSPDRADVILPAAIVLKAMAEETGLPEITIPRTSLKEGLLWDLAEGIIQADR